MRSPGSDGIKELQALNDLFVPRLYLPKNACIQGVQLHGFCSALEVAYSGIMYLRATDSEGAAHVALVMAKNKVALIKRL